VFSLAVIDSGDYHFLYDKEASFIREAYASPSTSGRPKYYAQFNGTSPSSAGNFFIGPTPDAAYPVELQYYGDPPSIVDAGASWLGENAETVLLYGSLIEAYTYLKGDADLMGQYTARYEEALAQLGGVEVRSKRDEYKDGQTRRSK
jgi:hypothetical protein